MKSAVLVGAIGGVALAVVTHDPTQALPLSRQAAPPRSDAPAAPKTTLLAPYFGNAKCPVDGNVVDRALFVPVDGQRVHACCAGCKESLELDPAKSLALAYPEARPLPTLVCVVCAADLVEGQQPTKSRKIAFQGRSVKLCSPECEKEFRARPGVWLARVTWPDAKDAENRLCPVDDRKVDGVTVVIWKGTLVRLCSFACIAPFEKEPEKAVMKAKGGT
jgi:hypothetical protein